MKTKAQISEKEVVWSNPQVKRTRVDNRIVYHNAAGDELCMDREQIDFEAAIVFERLREMAALLCKAKAITDVQEQIFLTLLDDGEKAIKDHYEAIREHIGPIYLERSGEDLIGCALELAG